ncbi:Cytochrome P450 [Mycena venus]|uniref:Cytochrome P450 n=1 Tax=Mycena venus TaxID=2733690 RepID=A0A8H6YMW7_9AGAR|nr:Cytochrome P450 [Mycena venus]
MGVLLSVIDQNFFPPKATWTTADVPDLSSRVVLVTGGNSGIGLETAKVLLRHNAKVYIACRSIPKGEAAIAALEKETGKLAILLPLDLSSLDSIKQAATEFNQKEAVLHVLFNNAGVMASPNAMLTHEGYDLQFGVNVLGHFYLTKLLLPSLVAGAKSSTDHVARIVNTSSQSHILGNINFATLKDSPIRSNMSPDDLYAQSKFANVVFSLECAKRYGPDGIVSTAVHPGMLTTDIGRHLHPLKRRFIHSLCHSPPMGAVTQLWAGTAPEAASANGKYLIPWARIGSPHRGTLDPEIGVVGMAISALLHYNTLRGDTRLFLVVGCFTALSVLLVLFQNLKWSAASMTLYRLSPLHPLYSFPGPLSYRVSNLRMAHLVMSGSRHTTIQRLHREYGKFVRIGPNSLSINSRSAVPPIYASAKCLDRSAAYRVETVPGDGLFFVLDRDTHHARRSIWAKAFTTANLDHFQPILSQRTVELAECMQRRSQENKGLVDLSRCIEDWSFDFMGDFAFGPGNSFELMRDGDPEDLVKNGKTATALFDIFGVVPWLLDILLDNEKESEKLTDDERTMDLVFAIQAGSDTTANVLQYIFFFLINHRNVYDRLSEELNSAFPTSTDFLNFQTLENLPYLNAVINEGLRLGTPLSGLERITPVIGSIIDDKFIPGNIIVSVPAYTQQLDPLNFFPYPEEYLPDRWLSGGLGEESVLEPNAVMSFSFGPYGCLGKALALQELRVVVARLVLDFHLEPATNFDAGAYSQRIRNIRTTFFPEPLLVKLKCKESEDRFFDHLQ